jgi:hypothetical protein
MTLKEQMDLLGWKDITTDRQISNGTRIYRLPIKQYGEYIEVGSFESGYVRRMNGCYTPYQLNKCEPYEEYFKDYKNSWDKKTGDHKQFWTGKYNKFVGKKRVKLMSTRKRLQYLIDYCLKNYYINLANQVEDGKYVPKWVYEDIKERYVKEINNVGQFLKCEDTDDMINFKYSGGQIENLENGDVFVHEQHAYWNKWTEEPPSSVEIIIDGHRYKVK